MSDRTSNEGGEPNSLFAYIGAQEFEAANSDELAVNEEALFAPDGSPVVDVPEDVSQVALPEPGPQPTPAEPAPDSEKIQLQQQLEQMRVQNQRQLAALTLVAQESKRREDALFEQKIELLSPEEADAERELRRVRAIEADNAYLRQMNQTREAQTAQAQDHIDKVAVAHRVIERLELPGDNQLVMATLMESDSFPEMVAKAQRIADVYKKTSNVTAKVAAQAANQAGVHAASGEVAPHVSSKATPVRQGNLIDMMRERQYAAG